MRYWSRVATNDDAVSDTELLERWAQGSVEAGNELIERHFAVVHRFFRHKVGSEIEDLVQQTFLACIEARVRFQGRSSFRTFVLAIARFQLFTHYAQRKRLTRDMTLSSLRDLGTSPTAAVARNEEERLLIEALQCIPLEAQTILELAYWEGLDATEIGRILELPLNTVYSRLRRAKLALREKLRDLAPGHADVMPIERRFTIQ